MKLETSSRRRPQSLNAVAAEIAATVLVHVSFWLLVLSMLTIQLAPWAIVVLALLPVLLYLVTRIPGVGNFMPVYAIFLPLLADSSAFAILMTGSGNCLIILPKQ